MGDDLRRLLNPSRIAVIGGGVWSASIARASERIGFQGNLVFVHPKGKSASGYPAVRSLKDVDGPIDAAFICVNRMATIGVVEELARLNCGGAVCFASGFSEATGEDGDAGDLQKRLVEAAGRMPILGPNCYGFVNALDGAAIWPDQHGLGPVDRGVAILTQSSNIAINLTMQQRGLPIAMMLTCGNMAQTSQPRLIETLLDDPCITAIGLHIEGMGDLDAWWQAAAHARDRGVPLLALKIGKSVQAQAGAMSHTAALAGADAGAEALLRHLGIGRTHDLTTFLECLKLLHLFGPLSSDQISSISCSGGEASLVADMAHDLPLSFPPLSETQSLALRDALGPMVALANPLDYHTYIWGNVPAMSAAWEPMLAEHIGLTMSVVDFPHTDARDWECTTQAALAVAKKTGRPLAIVSTLPELMPNETADQLMEGGVLPLCGLREALDAASIAAHWPRIANTPGLLPGPEPRNLVLIDEPTAKADLARVGLNIPNGDVITDADHVALDGPFALKSLGLAHKSEAGGVRLGLTRDDLAAAMHAMPGEHFLIEEMVTDGVAELLLGIKRDAAHGYILSIGAGGVLAELIDDVASFLVPTDRRVIAERLATMKIAALLNGYRGKKPAKLETVLDAIDALQRYVMENARGLEEVEVNPLICTPTRAVAVDALIRREAT